MADKFEELQNKIEEVVLKQLRVATGNPQLGKDKKIVSVIVTPVGAAIRFHATDVFYPDVVAAATSHTIMQSPSQADEDKKATTITRWDYTEETPPVKAVSDIFCNPAHIVTYLDSPIYTRMLRIMGIRPPSPGRGLE
jgi:hypothetical protein